MLAEFQQALVDLIASPELVVQVRAEPLILAGKYQLTDREFGRLVAIVRHRGMQCNCILYRANRLAPLALNVPDTCKALGSNLRDLASEFWKAYPETHVHFFVETDRFCQFLKTKVAGGTSFGAKFEEALARESAIITAALAESHIEGED
jgi:hypothetical protein